RSIASVDDNLGRVLDHLDQSGLAENTVVIYNSDQGFYLGDHGWFDKRWMYEESLRMPLLVRWPGVTEPGSENRELVQNLDFAETFLDMAGAPVPADMQGRSLVPLLKGQTPDDWRKSVYYHYYEFPGWHDVRRHYGVRTDRHKLIHYYTIGEWELFDLAKDPDELRSVYDDPEYAEVVTELKAELVRLRKECKADEFQEPPAAPVPANVELEMVLHYEPTALDAGTIADASGKGHHGKRQNVELVELDEPPGGRALKFSGKGAVVVGPPPESLDPTYRPLTVGAWCKPESPDGVILAHGNQVFGYSLYLKDRVPHFAVRLSGLLLEVHGNKPVEVDKWVHLAATINPAGRITIYQDGDEVGALDEGHFVAQPPRDGFNVGADLGGRVGEYDTPMHFRGLIRDVRLYWGVLADLKPWCNPDASQRGYSHAIDLRYELKPTAEVVLDQAAFGGFCVRCRKDGEITFTGPEGPVSLPWPHYLKPETDWPGADWYDLSVKLPGGKTVGVSVLDHPGNPPTAWHNLASLAMINPCILAAGPVTLKKGEPLVLRYRLVAHDGPAPVELLRTLSAQWRGE
ncbi:MAG: sulfatase/phosphatase domain-containing protein, partial [Planctomycetota bacterium]